MPWNWPNFSLGMRWDVKGGRACPPRLDGRGRLPLLLHLQRDHVHVVLHLLLRLQLHLLRLRLEHVEHVHLELSHLLVH